MRCSGGALPTDRLFTGHARDLGNDAMYFFKARYYDATLGQFQTPDLALPRYERGGPKDPQRLNRYAYALNNPLRLADPSGEAAVIPGSGSPTAMIYFIPGVLGQDPAYDQFLSDLINQLGGNVAATQVAAYGAGPVPDLATAQLLGSPAATLLRQLGITHDPYALPIAGKILEDRAQGRLGQGEQLDIIGYSGGASVALDVASVLGRYGVHVNNIVTLGGYVSGAKPANVGRWTAITGGLHPIGVAPLAAPLRQAALAAEPGLAPFLPAASPDQTIILPTLAHFPSVFRSYYDPYPRGGHGISAGEEQTLQAVGRALGLSVVGS